MLVPLLLERAGRNLCVQVEHLSALRGRRGRTRRPVHSSGERRRKDAHQCGDGNDHETHGDDHRDGQRDLAA